jgi:quercetin dioxygenase-like cupin family protein
MMLLISYPRITYLRAHACLAFTLLCAGAMLGQIAAAQAASDPPQSQSAEKDRIAFSRALPHLNGDHAKVTIVEVTYGPGASSPRHSHPCPVIGYVIAGALRTQVKGEPEAIYKAGQTFYEAPNGVHQVSANASTMRPVKFLAFFLCDHDTELSVAPIDAGGK